MTKSRSKISHFLAVFVGLVTVLAGCATGVTPGTEPGAATQQPGATIDQDAVSAEGLSPVELAITEQVPPRDAIELAILPEDVIMLRIVLEEAMEPVTAPGVAPVEEQIIMPEVAPREEPVGDVPTSVMPPVEEETVVPAAPVAPAPGEPAMPEPQTTDSLMAEVEPLPAEVPQVEKPDVTATMQEGEIIIPSAPEAAPLTPAINLVSAELVNGELTVKTQISGFTLAPEAIGMARVEGQGHWHVYIDGKLAGLSAMDSLAIAKDKLAEFGPGPHEITVQLHNNDHSLVSETAQASTKLDFGISMMAPTVQETAPVKPTIEIASAGLVNGDLVLKAKVSGFILDAAAMGGPKIEGRGNWQLLIDGQFVGESASDSITISKDKLAEFPGGMHEITVELHNTDYSWVKDALQAGTRLEFGSAVAAPEMQMSETQPGPVMGGPVYGGGY